MGVLQVAARTLHLPRCFHSTRGVRWPAGASVGPARGVRSPAGAAADARVSDGADYECAEDGGTLAGGEETPTGWGGGALRAGAARRDADEAAARHALALAVDGLLAQKATVKRLAAELGSWSSARMSIVDAEDGFLPWLRVRAAETAAAAAAAASRPGGLDGATRADVLALLCQFAAEQSGEREEVRARCTDMREPHEWYPAARSMVRSIVMHVGPTNSGKTYAAMAALKAASSGVYCGPLRLLAWEVHDKLNAEGVPCDLITGQERVEYEGARHAAVTVEMASLSARYECAVLDEIQMLGHEQRGWAWTRALLGVQADQVHVCGDETAVQLMRRLCALTGDQLAVHRYERLSPLAVAASPVPGLRDLRPGDAVIAFSRREIYALKAAIERQSGRRCCVVYGSLPPETRKEQAARFNADGERGVLVASDAIGMGLNLNIGRVVFSATRKFDGESVRPLLPTEVKQIGGRAGRFSSAFASGGTITCLGGRAELRFLHGALQAELPPLEACGLLPTSQQLEQYARSAPPQPFSKLLRAFFERVRTDSGQYFVCSAQELYRTARLLDPLDLSIEERLSFCLAPVDAAEPVIAAAFLRYATAHVAASRTGGAVRVGVRAPADVPRSDAEISRLETTHAVLDAYLWLSYKFEATFAERARAAELRERVGQLISQGLQGALSSRAPSRSAGGARGGGDDGDGEAPAGARSLAGAAGSRALAEAALGNGRRPSRVRTSAPPPPPRTKRRRGGGGGRAMSALPSV